MPTFLRRRETRQKKEVLHVIGGIVLANGVSINQPKVRTKKEHLT